MILAPDFRDFSFQISGVLDLVDVQRRDASAGKPDAKRMLCRSHEPAIVIEIPSLAEVEVRELLAVTGEGVRVKDAADDPPVRESCPDQAQVLSAEELVPRKISVMKPGRTNTPRIRIAAPVSTTIADPKSPAVRNHPSQSISRPLEGANWGRSAPDDGYAA
ncbi:MAG TPA: hypothetical protein VGH14_07200 [Solirubrobacterales bacterium]